MKIGLDVVGADALKRMANNIRNYPAVAERTGLEACNDAARTIITQSTRDIGQRYNLPVSYVRDQFKLILAGTNGYALIQVRKRGVRLARYSAKQLTVVAKKAKGDPLRGIKPGRKQAGVSIRELRSMGREKIPGGFLIPLRAGKEDGGNGMGLFIRTGKGKKDIEHLYGMAPFQAFRAWVEERQPDLQTMLVGAWKARMRREIAKATS